MGRCGCIQISSQWWYKYTFTFDGAEDVLVPTFANKQDIAMTWLYSKTLKFEDIRKMQRISAEGRTTDIRISEVAAFYNNLGAKIAVIRTL